MNPAHIHSIVKVLQKETKKYKLPIVTEYSYTKDPFKVLISCLLSLRTKDETTAEASKRLFALADNPSALTKINKKKLEKTIYPVGFYKRKSETLLDVCNKLMQEHRGNVPDEIDELLKLKGVGRKTANLVVTLGYGKPGICVDTHVHRISNRFGFIQTKTPEETEFRLRKILPKKYWIVYNDLLVTYGQNVCRPISPFCQDCPISAYCDRVGVEKSR